MKFNFYICETCGNIITFANVSGVPVHCCGKPMVVLEPNTRDASQEKHVPCVSIDGANVEINVGSVAHPMTAEHGIIWACIKTTNGYQLKWMHPGDAPVARFVLAQDEEFEAAYAYCNLHGLWMSTGDCK
ncbi:MAG: desulfoferrodoxin family protein [Clostridia bacterium]|nr:desulfoferrodoxin family protein [Clostridia bacterium]